MRAVTIHLPDELSEAISSPGTDLCRAALEALAAEAYRERKISHFQLGRLLGFETRTETDSFLKERGVEHEHSIEDLERDRETLRRLGL